MEMIDRNDRAASRAARQIGDSMTMAEISRAEVARERARRLQAEARATSAEERARAAEYRVEVAQWLVTLMRSELTGVEPRRSWWPWPRRTTLPQWSDAEERFLRSGRAVAQSS